MSATCATCANGGVPEGTRCPSCGLQRGAGTLASAGGYGTLPGSRVPGVDNLLGHSLFMCVYCPPLGLAALAFSFAVDGRVKAGAPRRAQAARRTAAWLLLLGLLLGTVAWGIGLSRLAMHLLG